MQNIKVIIGASYGDEGKGLATDFFGSQVREKDKMINILTNGGPQRGHTVELEDGSRHVFKHFGAASFRGAASYYAQQFLVNPMEFLREYDELCAEHKAPEAYMHPLCRFTTPWDMLTNQMLQEKRGIHNSCGFGIWETVLRYRKGFGIPFKDFAMAADLQDCFFSEGLLLHFEEDCETMCRLCPMREDDWLRRYQTVLFENAQGLLLDGNAPEEQEFTTPSTTGVGRVFRTVEKVFRGADVEVTYVTRSYLTRHGDGSMENQLSNEELLRQLPGVRADVTNVTNRYQGALRYGLADVDLLAARISKDFARCKSAAGNLYRPSVMVTHLNEYAGIDTDSLRQRFGTVYLSDGRTGRDVSPSLLQVTK